MLQTLPPAVCPPLGKPDTRYVACKFFSVSFSKHTPTHLASQLALHILIVGLFQEHAEILWSNGMFAVDHSRCNCFLPRITLFIESEDKGFTTSKTKGYFGNSAMFVHNMVQSEKIHCVAILLSKILDWAKRLSAYDIFSQGSAWESSFLQFDRLWTPFLAKAICI